VYEFDDGLGGNSGVTSAKFLSVIQGVVLSAEKERIQAQVVGWAMPTLQKSAIALRDVIRTSVNVSLVVFGQLLSTRYISTPSNAIARSRRVT
jgi:hypothetical protein